MGIRREYIKKIAHLGAAFLFTTAVPVVTTVIRAMCEKIDIEKQKINFYDSSCGKNVEITLEELLYGSLAAEMPASFHEEALKAQAVAIYSYFLYQNGINSILDLNSGNGKHIRHFVYSNPEKRKERWGENFEAYESKIRKAVNDVKNQVLFFENKPVLAMFFSSCYKQTTPCRVSFSQDLPYLTSVDSPEYEVMNLERSFEIKSSELAEILKSKFTDEDFAKKLNETPPESWFTIEETAENGNVVKMKILDEEIKGQRFRHLLGVSNVRSSNFTIKFDSEKESFIINSFGFGHGVGMSQWGANTYATQKGWKYTDILSHYYPGTEIKIIS